MDVLSNLFNGFQTALTFQNIYLCFIGCLWGTVVGVLPGIGPLAGITLLIPATFGMDATGAIIMLAGHLLRRHVRRFDHVDSDEHPGRIRLRRHVYRRLPDDP